MSIAATTEKQVAHKNCAQVLVVSDIHASHQTPRTNAAFIGFLHHCCNAASKQSNDCTRLQTLYLLGDIFEYWPGDDVLDDDNAPQHFIYTQIVTAIRSVVDAGADVYWISGNRDFLVRDNFFMRSGCKELPDPSIQTMGNEPVLLSHGDQYCTQNRSYMEYRAKMRNIPFQAQFLAKSLTERINIINQIRMQSQQNNEISDVDQDTINALFATHGVREIIHGHTHQSAQHQRLHNGQKNVRWVLSDWDFDHAHDRANAWYTNDNGDRGLIPINANGAW